jgi:hypothetical protein
LPGERDQVAAMAIDRFTIAEMARFREQATVMVAQFFRLSGDARRTDGERLGAADRPEADFDLSL